LPTPTNVGQSTRDAVGDDCSSARLLRERGRNRSRFAQCFVAGREDLVDGFNLSGMDRRLGAEAGRDSGVGLGT
jgi:hypothetical protein